MNYLIPVKRISNKEKFNVWDKRTLDDILDQQIMISQLSTAFTFADTDGMDNYERNYILQRLIELKKEENEVKKKAIEDMKNKHQ